MIIPDPRGRMLGDVEANHDGIDDDRNGNGINGHSGPRVTDATSPPPYHDDPAPPDTGA